MKLYVGNLPFNADEDDLREFFGRVGPVQNVTIIRERETKRSRGFGFVELDDQVARRAMRQLDGQDFLGRLLTVNEARPVEPRERRQGSGRPHAGR